jgi:hypothetical protein
MDGYPPKLLSLEAQLARLWRAEKKTMYDQIRSRIANVEEGRSGPTAGNRHTRGQVEAGAQLPHQSFQATIPIQTYVRQKSVEVPYRGQSWAIFRKHIRRRFKLKQWRWVFKEQIGVREWCKKL